MFVQVILCKPQCFTHAGAVVDMQQLKPRQKFRGDRSASILGVAVMWCEFLKQ